jgi:hypothetical protein
LDAVRVNKYAHKIEDPFTFANLLAFSPPAPCIAAAASPSSAELAGAAARSKYMPLVAVRMAVETVLGSV